MAKVTGIDFLVYTKIGETPTLIGGQRGASLSLTTDAVDVTAKDSDGWEENIPHIRHWSIDFDGLLIEDDAGLTALESAYMSGTQLIVEFSTPGGSKYTGTATLTDFSYDTPYDAEATYSGTLQGSGPLTKTP